MENRHFWLWQKYFLVQEGAMKDKNKMATAVTLLTALRMFTNGKQIFNFPWFNKMSRWTSGGDLIILTVKTTDGYVC